MKRASTASSVTSLAGVALAACAEDVPELPTALDALVLDTLFELAAATGESWQTFEGVWDVEVDAEGRVAILDIGGPAVHVYDARGRTSPPGPRRGSSPVGSTAPRASRGASPERCWSGTRGARGSRASG
jgi:hypothetical protein